MEVTPVTLDAVHYALAGAVVSMAVAWWRHVQAWVAKRDAETVARVEATNATEALTAQVAKMSEALVKMAERSPLVGDTTVRGLKRPES